MMLRIPKWIAISVGLSVVVLLGVAGALATFNTHA
jgi:hypothetical protein